MFVSKPKASGYVRYGKRPKKEFKVPLKNGQVLAVASGYEQAVLLDLVARNVPFSYEPDSLEIQLPLRGANCSKCGAAGKDLTKSGVYTVDVRLDLPRTAYVELKGKLDGFGRTRLKALYANWGGKFPMYLLFQKNNKLNAGSKTTYREWAEKVGFRVAVGSVLPHEWIEELSES